MNVLKKMKLAFIPLMFVAMSVTMLDIPCLQLRGQGKYTAAVNLAGRQRMLNQRHMLETLMQSCGNKADYRATRTLMRDSLDERGITPHVQAIEGVSACFRLDDAGASSPR